MALRKGVAFKDHQWYWFVKVRKEDIDDIVLYLNDSGTPSKAVTPFDPNYKVIHMPNYFQPKEGEHFFVKQGDYIVGIETETGNLYFRPVEQIIFDQDYRVVNRP